MQVAIAVLLVAMWLVGVVTSYTMGGLVHVLLLIGTVVIVVRLMRGQNVFRTRV